jgi:hypothetical protein
MQRIKNLCVQDFRRCHCRLRWMAILITSPTSDAGKSHGEDGLWQAESVVTAQLISPLQTPMSGGNHNVESYSVMFFGSIMTPWTQRFKHKIHQLLWLHPSVLIFIASLLVHSERLHAHAPFTDKDLIIIGARLWGKSIFVKGSLTL